MNYDKTKRRDRTKLSAALLVATLSAMLGAMACSADEGSAGEPLGSVAQGLACGKLLPCPESSECGTWSCELTLSLGTCQVTKPQPNGTRCSVTAGSGVCVDAVCCTGCVTTNKAGDAVCNAGSNLTACGLGGRACANCNKGNTCERYSCVAEKGACDSEPIADKEPCSDGNGACYEGACCAGCIDGRGACQAGTAPTECGFSSAKDELVACRSCDDGNPCTVDTCEAGVGCKNTPVEAGTICDDGDVCNGISKCELAAAGIACRPGTAPDCNDKNDCTDDSCDAQRGCRNVNNTALCNDLNRCTLVDRCSDGECRGTGERTCEDNEPCTDDVCLPATGCAHRPKAENSSCDDRNGCTVEDKCTAGVCGGVGASCADQNPCTRTNCTPNGGCSNDNEQDGTACVFNRCYQNSACQAGTCTAGEPIDCEDNNPCTEDRCDAEAGCVHVALDDGDCSDGDVCTTGDSCKEGACVGSAVECTAIDDCHVAGECDPRTGQCNDPRADDDISCEDGTGTCQAGKCVTTDAGVGGAGGGGEPSTDAAGQGAGGDGVGGVSGEAEGGAAQGGTETHSGGQGTDPDDVFVRKPGGCSCSVPGSSSQSPPWLAALALLAALGRRRRRPHTARP
jgi:MYXO-CTERM domain-containing protein